MKVTYFVTVVFVSKFFQSFITQIKTINSAMIPIQRKTSEGVEITLNYAKMFHKNIILGKALRKYLILEATVVAQLRRYT